MKKTHASGDSKFLSVAAAQRFKISRFPKYFPKKIFRSVKIVQNAPFGKSRCKNLNIKYFKNRILKLVHIAFRGKIDPKNQIKNIFNF